MRAEDRKPSKRVFPLLQNTDLDSVTFAQLQSTGDPITLEDMNVQELEDLLLCQFARLAVKSEWTGLLEAGGGTMDGVISPAAISATYDINRIDCTPPWGFTVGNNGTPSRQEPQWAPFVSPESGDVASISIDIASVAASAVNLNVALYSDDDGLPNAKLTEAVFDAETDGLTTQTSLTGTATLVAGTQYWFAHVKSADVDFTITCGSSGMPWVGPTAALTSQWTILWYPSASAFTLPATVTKTTLEPRGYTKPSVGIEFA